MKGGLLSVVLAAAAFGAAACAALHIRAVNEGSSGPLHECDAIRCKPAQTDDPSRTNLGRLAFYELPAGCVALSRAILRTDGPTLDVTCGQPGSEASHRCERGASCHPLVALPEPRLTDVEIDLPEECGGRIHELVIVDATEPTARAFIECDASSGPVGEM